MLHSKKILKKLFSFSSIFLCSLFFLSSSVSYAEESLHDLHARLDSYLDTPIKRAIALQGEVKKLDASEKTLASGFGIAVSDIYEHKAAITKAIAEYYLLDSIKVENEKSKNVTFTPKEATKILSSENFLMKDMVTILKVKYACLKTVHGYEQELASRQEAFKTSKETLERLETEYRQLSETVDNKAYSSWDRDKFRLSKLKAEIEAQSTNMAICKLYSNLVTDLLRGFQVQYEDLKIAANKCIANPSKLIGESNFLDHDIEGNTSWCWSEYTKIAQKRSVTSKLHLTSPTLIAMQSRLDALANTDTLLLLSLAENWSYLLRNWYCLLDVIKNVLPISYTEQLQKYTDFAQNFIQQSNQTAMMQLSTLKTLQNNMSSLNLSKLTRDDKIAFTNFDTEIKEMLQRVDKYLVQLKEMGDQTQIIGETSEELVNKSDKKVFYFGLFRTKLGSFLTTELFTLGERPITIAKLLIAVALLLLAHLISKRVSLRIKKRFDNGLDKNSASLQKLASITIWFFTLLVILWQLRIPITAFAFIGGYGALAIGIGMQRILGNAIAGIIILVQKRVRVGDMLTIDGTWGKVKEITLMNTVLSCALASEHVIIPNSKILDLSVKNHTWQDNYMRSLIYFWVSGEKDVENTKSVIDYVITNDDTVVVKSRPYFIRVADLGNDSVKFEVAYFFDVTKFLPKDSQAVLREKIFTEFRKRNIVVRDQDTVIQMVTGN